jgi:hypothetical protein
VCWAVPFFILLWSFADLIGTFLTLPHCERIRARPMTDGGRLK